MKIRIVGIGLLALFSFGLIASTATAQIAYQTLDFGSDATFLTGIRDGNIVGNYVIPGGSATGGLLYNPASQSWSPLPVATPSGTNVPGATASSPYGPNFGSEGGILRVVGSYQTATSSPYNIGYLYDGAAAPNAKLTTLSYPGAPVLETIAHSTFGNQIVGNYDTRLATGNAFIYNIKIGTYTTNNMPGAVSTTAYGVWGDKIAGGYADLGPGGGPGFERGYIYDESTGVWTSYNHPGAVATHFEGITGGGRAGQYNLVANWFDLAGNEHASVLHLGAGGKETWIDYAVPGAALTSANSIYGSQAIGIYVDANGAINGYVATIPGIYDPMTNSGILSISGNGTPAIAGASGDDVVNNGTILTSGIRSPGIRGGSYGVITNNGSIAVTGAGSAAVELNGLYGTLLNQGSIRAAPGGYAIRTGPTASGSAIVNDGTIDGRVAIAKGADARFENSGWLGISAPGAGTMQRIGGVFAQTDAGTLALRLAANGGHDALRVVGTAQLAGGLVLQPQPGLYAGQRLYSDLVLATDTLRGGFATVSTGSPFLRASLVAAPDSISAVLTRTPFDAFPGLTRNQRAIGSGLEQGYVGASTSDAGLYSTLLTSQVPPVAVAASYDAIGGEGITGSQQTIFDAADSFIETIREQGGFWLSGGEAESATEAASNPPGDPPGNTPARQRGWRVWADGSGGGGRLESDPATGAAPLATRSWGGAAGLDYQVTPNLLAGIAAGGSASSFSVSERGTNGTADGGQLGIYGLDRWSRLYTSGALAWGRYGVGTTRSVAAFGLAGTDTGNFAASVYTGRIEAGYMVATPFAEVTPFAAFEPAWISLPNFDETAGATGSPLFALAYSGRTAASLPTSLGVQLDRTALLANGWTLAPYLRVAWVHEFDGTRSLTANLLSAPGAGFSLSGTPAPEDSALLTGSLKLTRAGMVSLYANITTDLSPHGQSAAANLTLALNW